MDNNVISKNNPQENTKTDSSSESILDVFTRYKSSLKYFISSYVINSQDVDDVCQETFLRTYKTSLENEVKTPKSFMFKVAKNLILSDFRRASTQLNEYVEDIDLVENQLEINDLESNSLAQEKLGVMCEAIASLPNKCRQVVVMRKVYGMKTRDIAKRMNISTITVSNYITKGMCAYNDARAKYTDEHNEEPSAKPVNTSIKTGRVS
ncbi:RNA polymerase sigma factor [Psychrosphaera sp. B3R10]|uniref:RNA polymerase sigma factor n=1 Tax=unclassified Psychrosphaera TaxID=2641570 RepID=UPI001C096AA4|nr:MULTISPECIES: RNA polymerase sigma factor [unclassified Psychrosphaera]MBU2881493.1 RNA polymerase sigma factor [Psychrosphaera sp. I2R16]MBU2989495.1 RNA polymerase sigma factor [Psychrosphaera sp. B3R10]